MPSPEALHARALIDDLRDSNIPPGNYEDAQLLRAFEAVPAGSMRALLAQLEAEAQHARDHANLLIRRATVASAIARRATGIGE